MGLEQVHHVAQRPRAGEGAQEGKGQDLPRNAQGIGQGAAEGNEEIQCAGGSKHGNGHHHRHHVGDYGHGGAKAVLRPLDKGLVNRNAADERRGQNRGEERRDDPRRQRRHPRIHARSPLPQSVPPVTHTVFILPRHTPHVSGPTFRADETIDPERSLLPCQWPWPRGWSRRCRRGWRNPSAPARRSPWWEQPSGWRC